ncbi:MAG: glycoside hydrolase family 127 protein [Anaerolineae bacterium]
MVNSKSLKHIPWYEVRIEGGFWGERQSTNRSRTIPAIYHQTRVSGRLDAWKPAEAGTPPKTHIFWDSDTAKWIESVAYSVATHPNAEFEQQVDEVVDLMAKVQLADGYANSHFIAAEPENRWRNLRDQHELYCAGHLIEAAITYAQATGKHKMLDVLRRYADHIEATFGRQEEQKRGYPGHPELELALVRLFHATGDERYLNLSKYFVDERGQQPHYYDLEALERGEDPRKFWARNYNYCQAHMPIREQSVMTGHSVRACYLYAAVADLALETHDAELLEVSRRLWNDLTQRQMYITGGVGTIHTIEGFTFDYDLPNETTYGETCAAIAVIYWSQRMFALDADSRYFDVIERALYNGMISGVSYEGEHFFQANPLASYPNISPYDRLSDLAAETYYRRTEWFDVACCPSNLSRLVASVGGYFYSVTADRMYVHLYNQNRAEMAVGGNKIQLEQQTNYPWDEDIQLTLTMVQPTHFELALRMPRWCRSYQLEVNGEAVSMTPERGYLVIAREWQNGDRLRLTLEMPIERIVANPLVREDVGRVALQRGPVVYCLEEVDNGANLASVVLPREAPIHYAFDDSLFGGVGTINGEAMRLEFLNSDDELYRPEPFEQLVQKPFVFKAIPYCFWANRQPGEMRVWLLKSS